LVVLHDQEGHPLLVTTHRGDQHLTIGLPAILTHYEQAADLECLNRIVVDREGMSAEFLAALASDGRTVVTVLRTDQYVGVQSFREVGAFVPLQGDRQGQVIREVALARFGLPLSEHAGQELEVRVALIRDWHRLVPKTPSSNANGRPITPATKSSPNVRSIVGSSVSYSEPLRIWHNKSGRCTNWKTTKIR
jgi:hypothetical protein